MIIWLGRARIKGKKNSINNLEELISLIICLSSK